MRWDTTRGPSTHSSPPVSSTQILQFKYCTTLIIVCRQPASAVRSSSPTVSDALCLPILQGSGISCIHTKLTRRRTWRSPSYHSASSRMSQTCCLFASAIAFDWVKDGDGHNVLWDILLMRGLSSKGLRTMPHGKAHYPVPALRCQDTWP